MSLEASIQVFGVERFLLGPRQTRSQRGSQRGRYPWVQRNVTRILKRNHCPLDALSICRAFCFENESFGFFYRFNYYFLKICKHVLIWLRLFAPPFITLSFRNDTLHSSFVDHSRNGKSGAVQKFGIPRGRCASARLFILNVFCHLHILLFFYSFRHPVLILFVS